MQWIRDFDPTEQQRERFDEESWDFSITAWRLLKKDGELIPCNRENKVLLMRRAPKFSLFYTECMDKLRDGLRNRKEDELKNL
jgi:hypothetical protein